MSRQSQKGSKNPMFDEDLGREVAISEHNDIDEASQPEENNKEQKELVHEDSSSRFLSLQAKPEVAMRSLIMLGIATFYLGFTFMFLFNFQTFFLLNKQGNKFTEFDKPVQRMDTTQQIWILIFSLVWGYLSDKYGRRLIMSLGFVQMALGLYFVPTTTDILPGYMITYVLFAQGYTAVFVSFLGLVYEYFQPNSRAKALSIYFATYSIGTLLGGTTYTYGAVETLCVNNMYHVAATFSLVIGALCFGLIKNVQQFPQENGYICSALRKGFVFSFKNKILILAFVAAAMGFAANIVPRFFIVGWMHRDFHARGACGQRCIPIGNNVCYERFTVCEEDVRDFNRVGCNDGHTRMMDMARVVAPMQIVTSILFYVASRFSSQQVLTFGSVFIAISFGLVSHIEGYSLSEENAMVLNYFWAISGILGLLCASYLLVDNLEAGKVGLLCGMFFAFAQVGALFGHGLGGYLFGVKSIGAPFIVVMWLAIICAVLGAISAIYSFRKEYQATEGEGGQPASL